MNVPTTQPAGHPSTLPKRRSTLRRAMAGALLSIATIATLLGVSAAPASASWYSAKVVYNGVTVRDCFHPTVHWPSTSCTYQTFLSAGTQVHIVCQHAGQNIYGDDVWDYVTYSGGEGYVSDYYILTNHSSWIPGVDVCTSP